MMTLNDGRSELWQWDTGRTLAVDADCSQVHFSNKVFGRSIDVDVIDGVAIIPDILLQTDKDLNVWAFVGTAENGYTKISKTFKVNRRNKPADYVFTPVEQTTIAEIAAIAQSVRDDADAGMFDGAQGPAGPVGPVGPKGDTGETGPAGAGVPDGGTAGQLLSKTETGTEWIDPPQSGVQSDWNQNDDTQPDYVKNRPFYTGDPVETVLVEESTVQFTDVGGLYAGAIESTFSPTVGNAYKISWDGTDYESTCVKVGQYTNIGNLSIDGSGPDTGEPFLMQVTNQQIDIATLYSASYHTISISGFGAPEVVKIDKKYLPDNGNPLNITGATVDQIAKITAVDDSGKPTAWEAADMPSGGGSAVALDTTLTQSGKAADAAAVGERISALSEEIVTTSESKVAAHNSGTDTHSDIRMLIQGLTDRLNALADSDDTTLDQLSEVVAYIKSNRSLIEAITTNKVSVADIIDNLTTNVTNKPLSAAQGVALKALIDAVKVPSDDHINSLIDTKLGVVENGSY